MKACFGYGFAHGFSELSDDSLLRFRYGVSGIVEHEASGNED
jgi:hypothetical protein